MKVKKIAALAVGAAMVGATIGFASATNVPQIPKSFFVKDDGTPNVKIVVGSNAAAMDVASAADIAVALGSLLYTTEQVEAQGDYVKVKAEFPPKTIQNVPIYVYNASTVEAHNGDWASNYTDLESKGANYWYNGASYTGGFDPSKYTVDFSTWQKTFKIVEEAESQDKVKGYYVDWEITIKNINFTSIEPKKWKEDIPPKKADINIAPGNATITIDYVLYNYTVTYKTKVVTDEFGFTSGGEKKSFWYIGDADDNKDYKSLLPDDANTSTVQVSNKKLISGVKAGDTFTVFGKEYKVYEVGNQSFIAGVSGGPEWLKLHETRLIGDRWKVTIQDIGIQQTPKNAIVLVTDTQTDQYVTFVLEQNKSVYVYYDSSGQLTYEEKFPSGIENGLMLKLDDAFVGIDNTIMASIEYAYNLTKYTSDNFHPAEGWNVTISTKKDGDEWYITSVTLINDKELNGNPADIAGLYDLYYVPDFRTETAKVNGEKVTHIVGYAYLKLTEKEGKVKEIELKPGETLKYVTSSGDVKEAKYNTVEEIHATLDQIVLKPATQPITVMDFEVDVNDPGSNLILVGGPVANSVTKYLVENNISKVDWYNSPGDVEYIPDAFGSYGAVIVAGATRNETKVAAEALMQYLAELAKE